MVKTVKDTETLALVLKNVFGEDGQHLKKDFEKQIDKLIKISIKKFKDDISFQLHLRGKGSSNTTLNVEHAAFVVTKLAAYLKVIGEDKPKEIEYSKNEKVKFVFKRILEELEVMRFSINAGSLFNKMNIKLLQKNGYINLGVSKESNVPCTFLIGNTGSVFTLFKVLSNEVKSIPLDKVVIRVLKNFVDNASLSRGSDIDYKQIEGDRTYQYLVKTGVKVLDFQNHKDQENNLIASHFTAAANNFNEDLLQLYTFVIDGSSNLLVDTSVISFNKWIASAILRHIGGK